jgi:hypothetical protein
MCEKQNAQDALDEVAGDNLSGEQERLIVIEFD